MDLFSRPGILIVSERRYFFFFFCLVSLHKTRFDVKNACATIDLSDCQSSIVQWRVCVPKSAPKCYSIYPSVHRPSIAWRFLISTDFPVRRSKQYHPLPLHVHAGRGRGEKKNPSIINRARTRAPTRVVTFPLSHARYLWAVEPDNRHTTAPPFRDTICALGVIMRMHF